MSKPGLKLPHRNDEGFHPLGLNFEAVTLEKNTMGLRLGL